MMAAKDFIVAIEFGSSKVTGIAGQKNLDGSIKVLAVVKEDSSSFIRKGVVNNIDKTANCLTNIVNKLKAQLQTDITQVYVGVGGQSIRSVKNTITKDLPSDTKVTQDVVDELMDTNYNKVYPDQEIIDVAIHEYQVDSQQQLDPVGMQCTHLEGNFLNILQRTKFYKNLNDSFESAGISIAEMFLAPIALADSVLTEAEKRSGCALVDIGSDTTTISVYSKNILRHLAVIPLGSNNITKDIASLQMEESDAEKLKLKYACAYTDNSDIDSSLMLTIDHDRQIESHKFIEIVESRLEEIIQNVRYQIPSDYYDKLLGGIILTGGGSNMKEIEKAFATHTNIEKIRIAKFVTQTIISSDASINAKNGTMNTILGLLAKGEQNCAGSAVDPNGEDLFGGTQQQPASTDRPTRPTSERQTGVVLTEADKKAIEEAQRLREEAQKQKEEEEARIAEEEKKRIEEEKRKQEEEERRKRKENSMWNKFKKKVIDIVSESD